MYLLGGLMRLQKRGVRLRFDRPVLLSLLAWLDESPYKRQ